MRKAALLAAALLALVAPSPAAAADDDASSYGQHPPLTLVSDKAVDSRLRELVFKTPYLDFDTYVRVLLPAGYDPNAARRYPVLLLLHGAFDDPPQARDWSMPGVRGDVEKDVGAAPMIVVMPDGGRGGFYSDWYNNGAFGNPRWESYHIGQLMPWIDSHYRTTPGRSGHAIAGLSMGGFGTMSYAARHPDLFLAAASFSGAVDSTHPSGIVEDGAGLDGPPGSIWGSRVTETIRWRAHNPLDLAENLRGMNLALITGNGMPGGPYGPAYPDPLEAPLIHPQNVALHDRLDTLGIAHLWDDYGPGGHTWDYWNRDLRETVPRLMEQFAHPPAAPSPFQFDAVEPNFAVYGYDVHMHRDVLEFARLQAVRRGGFTLTGSGSADVVTPPSWPPRRRVRVRIANGGATTTSTAVAGRDGRVRVHLDLGPSNTVQEDAPGDVAPRNRTSVTVRLTIRR
jgi:S-formylglutathione hydrolase FrmB